MKPGIKTTEFWVAQISSVVTVVLAILAQQGVIVPEEEVLLKQLAVALAPLVIAIIQATYIYSRTAVKTEFYKASNGFK